MVGLQIVSAIERSFWLGTDQPERPTIWLGESSFEPCGISSTSREGKKGLEIEFNHIGNESINHAYIMKPQ